MEAFEGSLNGTSGSFNFVHTASTTGSDRTDEHFAIVPSSGTGDLAGIGDRRHRDGSHDLVRVRARVTVALESYTR